VERIADSPQVTLPRGLAATGRFPELPQAAEVQPTVQHGLVGLQPPVGSNPQDAQNAPVTDGDQVVAGTEMIEERSGETRDRLVATAENLSGSDGSASAWTKYQLPEGNGYWWHCESDGESFIEDAPGAWSCYSDPDSGRRYWWKSDDKWFWV